MLASDIKMVSLASSIVNSQQQLYAAQQLTLTNLKVTEIKIESPTDKSSDDAINNKSHSQPVSQKSQTANSTKNKKSHHSYNRKKYHTYQSQHFNNTTVNRANMPNNNNNNSSVNKNQGVSEKLNVKIYDSKSGKKYPQQYNTENSTVVPKNKTPNIPSQSANVTTTIVKSKSSPKLDTQTQLSTNTTPPGIENRLNPQQQPPGVGTVVAEKDKMQQDQQDSNVKQKPNKRKYWRNSNTHNNVINTNGEIPAKSTVVNPTSSNNNNCNNSDKSQLPIKGEVSNKASLLAISQNNKTDNKDVGTIATVPSSNNIITTVETKVETSSINDTKDAIIITTTPSISTEPAQPNTEKTVLQVPDICADTVTTPTPTAAIDAENSVTKTASTCTLDSSIDSSNTYSLAFLHSVGADITGSKQNKVEIVNDAIKFVVEPPTRPAIITDTNNNNTYKPIRYPQTQNSATDGQQYQQYPYYHHQPSQLTIASFLQKDMLVETTVETNKRNYNQQSYTQQHRYQNFPHSNYSAQPHHHQYPAHKNNNGKHTPMHYSNENKMDNYIMRHPTKYHNHNVHTTIMQPHPKRSTNTGSLSSTSSATTNTTKVISYRRQSHYKFRSHTTSAIETLSTKTFRHQQRNHYNNQSHYNNHYNNYQHNSGGSTQTSNTQHQNFNNLTYVSTDGYIGNNMSNVMKSHSRSPLKSASNMYINVPNSIPSKFLNCSQLDAATTNNAGVGIRPNISVEQKRPSRNINNNCESNDFQSLNYSMPSPKSNSTSASLNSLHNQDSNQRSTHSMKMQNQGRKESDNKMCVVHPSYYHHHHHQQHVDRRQHITNVHHQYYTNSVMPMLNYHAGYYDESYSQAHVIYTSSDHSINITNRNWSHSAANMMYPPTAPNVVPATVSTGSITPTPSPRSQDADIKLDRSSSLSSISTTSDTLTLDSTKMSSTSNQDQQQELSEKQQLPHANVQQERPNSAHSNSSRKSTKIFSTDIRIISTTQILTSIQHIPSRSKPTIMSLVNNEHEMVYAPSDRYMARAHLVEVKQEPKCLLTNTKFDLLSRQIWAKFAECQQTRETFVEKMRLWRYIYILIKLKMKTTYPRYGLYLVGSTISGFGSDISDVDMCLVARAPANQDTRVDALVNLQLLKKCLEEEEDEFEKFNLIEAKVPILRFKQKQNDYEVDLNFNNSVGIKNTHLLYSYSQIDWRVRPLVLVTKLWAQYHNINNAKNMTISSYSLALMVINYLQCGVKPIILPCLHDLYPEKFTFLRIHDFGNVDMNEDIGCSFQSENTQTIGELFLGFLDYYYKFEYGKYAISVRTAGLLPVEVCRQAKSSKNDMHQWKVLCIEEPFDLTNTARSVYDFETFEHIKSIMFNSWRTLSNSLNLNSIFGPLFVVSTDDSEMNLPICSGDTSNTNSLIPSICEKEPNESTTSNSSHSSEEVSTDSSETSESVSSTLSMLKEIINQVADSSLNAAEMILQEKKHQAEESNDIHSNGSSESSSCSGAVKMPQNNRSSCKTEPPNLTTIIF